MSNFKQYLRESIQQEAYRALEEQGVEGWTSLGPGGGTEGQVNPAPQAYNSKTSIGNRYPKSGKSPNKPLSAKAYMENLYSGLWGRIMDFLRQIWGDNWFAILLANIHNPNFHAFDGWTAIRGADGSTHYTMNFGGETWYAQFVNGSWMFSVT